MASIFKSIKDYIKNIAPIPSAYQAIRQDARSKGAASLSMREIDREIAAVRKQQARKKSKGIHRIVEIAADGATAEAGPGYTCRVKTVKRRRSA
jgi:hypothetical protein